MKPSVVWSPRAKEEYETILSYLSKEWGNKVTLHFLNKTDSLINTISRFPSIYPAHNTEKNIRKCVLTKHITLFYRYQNDPIELLSFWDNRQDPHRLRV